MPVLSDPCLSELYPEYRGDVGPASIDLHLGSVLWFWPDNVLRDPRQDQSSMWERATLLGGSEDAHWILTPGVRFLAATRERIRIPDDCAGQIGARSSWARDGLSVIQGPAGYLDPGYCGSPTLELSVIGSDLVIWPGAGIAQLILHRLTSPAERPYGHPSRLSKYQGDDEPTPSRLHLEIAR